MALVQTTTKSPVASEAVATAGGAKAPATGLVFTTNSGASGVWLSSMRSSSTSTLGRLRRFGRGDKRRFLRLRDSEGNMKASEEGCILSSGGTPSQPGSRDVRLERDGSLYTVSVCGG